MRKRFLFASLMITFLIQAKEHTIRVRGTSGSNTVGTTVIPSSHGGDSDTLTVRPAVDASIIIVALKDPDGTVLDERQCAATWNDQVTIIAPAAMPHGYFLEVRDDKGFLYREFNQ